MHQKQSGLWLGKRFIRDSKFPVLVLLGTCCLGGIASAQAEKKSTPLSAALGAAVRKGQVEKGRLLGFALSRQSFEELPGDGGILVGFDLGIGKFVNIETIYAIRPVYRVNDAETSGGDHGLFVNKVVGKKTIKTKVLRTVKLRARPGYAVGSVTMRTGLNINGLMVTFMQINGNSLDPDHYYRSEWIGDQSGGNEGTLSSDGAPIVGVYGNRDDDHVTAFGLIYVKDLEARPKPAPPAPKFPAKPTGPAARAPGEPVAPEARRMPVPVDRVVDHYINHEYHFSFMIPDGWRRMSRSELDRIDEVLRQRQLDSLVQYETGFRPVNSSPGEFPYILLQIQPMQTAGLSYEEIQRSLNLGIDGPMKKVEGAFSDIIKELAPGTITLDRDRDRILIRMQAEMIFVGKVDGVSVTHLGSEAVVSIHCYAKEKSFQTHLPTFNDVNSSFAFDDGFGFVPAKSKRSSLLGLVLPVLAFLAVTVVLAGAFFIYTVLKPRTAPAVPHYAPPPDDLASFSREGLPFAD
jgi:hypothetical protein